MNTTSFTFTTNRWILQVTSTLALAFVLVLVGCDSGGANSSNGDSDPPGDTGPGTNNDPPQADVTVDSSDVEVGTEVTADASGSDDPDGDDLSFDWSIQTPGDSQVSLSEESGETATFTPDVNGDYDVEVQVDDGTETAADSALVDATVPTVEITAEEITEDRTLKSSKKYLIAPGEPVDDPRLTVEAPLTIEPGTEIFVEEGKAILVLGDDGKIRADGSAEKPIVFKAAGGSESGDWWDGIELRTTGNVLDHVEIRHASGSGIDSESALAVDPGSGSPTAATVELTNTTITNGAGYGLSVEAAVPEGGKSPFISFSGNTFGSLDKGAMKLPFDLVPQLNRSEVTFANELAVEVFNDDIDEGGGLNGPAVIGTLGENGYYRFATEPGRGRSPVILGSDTIRVEAGTEMKFGEGVALELGRRYGEERVTILAEGTAENPITLSATPGNKQPGWWDGIESHGHNTTFENVIVRHAGEGGVNDANIEDFDVGPFRETPDTLRIRNSAIEQSAGYGILCKGGTVFSEEGSSFSNIADENIEGCK